MGACGVERTSQQRGGVEWYGEESPLGCLAGGQRVSSQWDDVLIRLESTSGEPTVSPVSPMGKFGGLLQEIRSHIHVRTNGYVFYYYDDGELSHDNIRAFGCAKDFRAVLKGQLKSLTALW